ncbi:hypothetical protein TNCV_3952981 [Trichonephila clavipes]|nr:hypothetical protein TNCV_3952981 [Trichonephila clavipes]
MVPNYPFVNTARYPRVKEKFPMVSRVEKFHSKETKWSPITLSLTPLGIQEDGESYKRGGGDFPALEPQASSASEALTISMDTEPHPPSPADLAKCTRMLDTHEYLIVKESKLIQINHYLTMVRIGKQTRLN